MISLSWLDTIDIIENLDQVLKHAQHCKILKWMARETKGGYWVRVEAGSLGWEGAVDEEGLKKIEAKIQKLQAENLDIEVVKVLKRVPRSTPLSY
jgi:hypothetical protein